MTRKEDELSQNEAKKSKGGKATLLWTIFISIGLIGLFLFLYISSLARGFANS